MNTVNFTNGTYDLNTSKFSASDTPTKTSVSTGYDYIHHNKDSVHTVHLLQIISEILPCPRASSFTLHP
jgi:phage/plasmid-associated DNA primase